MQKIHFIEVDMVNRAASRQGRFPERAARKTASPLLSPEECRNKIVTRQVSWLSLIASSLLPIPEEQWLAGNSSAFTVAGPRRNLPDFPIKQAT
jgi:hypothetical protein